VTFSAFHEQHGLFYLVVLQESLPMCAKSSHGRNLETMEWAGKPSELRLTPLKAGSLN
jgi:hypothetical protein